MSDNGPNTDIVKERLRLELMQFETNKQKQLIRIMELEEEKGKIQMNRDATDIEIEKIKKQLGLE